MIKAETHISTLNGSRYIKRLCKHFSHKISANFSENKGHADFPFGDCEMKSDDRELIFFIEAETEDKLQEVKSVLEVHLDKFSKNEELQVEWEVYE